MADTECNLRAMSQKLLPCPFCGSDAHLAWYNNGEKQIVVECENPYCLNAVCGSQTAEEALMRWNRRVKATGLKPCPFCGERAGLVHYQNGESEMYTVECTNADCQAETTASNKAEEVIRMWNRRMNDEGDSE